MTRAWMLDTRIGRVVLLVVAAWRGLRRDDACLTCDAASPAHPICAACQREALRRAREGR